MRKEIELGRIRADWFWTIMRHIDKHGIGGDYGKLTSFCSKIKDHKIYKSKLNLKHWKIKISLVNDCEEINENDYGLDD